MSRDCHSAAILQYLSGSHMQPPSEISPTDAVLDQLGELRLSISQLEAELLVTAQDVRMDWAGVGAIVGLSAPDAEQRYREMRAGGWRARVAQLCCGTKTGGRHPREES